MPIGLPPIVFEEADGSPSVRQPRKVILPNGSISASGKNVTINPTPSGSVTLGALAPLASFSVIGNETASSATPTAVKMMGIPGQTSTATAAGTTTLTNLSKGQQIFTGATTQTVVLPVVSTLPILGFGYWIINNSSDALTVNSSGSNLVLTIAAGARALVFCKLLTGTSAASWDYTLVASPTLFQSAILGTSFPKDNDTLAVVTGFDKDITLIAGHIYQIAMRLYITSGDGGSRIDFNGGTFVPTALQGMSSVLNGNDNTVSAYTAITALTDLVSTPAAGGAAIEFVVDFTVEVATGGTLKIRFAEAVTDVTASTLLKYATITATDVT